MIKKILLYIILGFVAMVVATSLFHPSYSFDEPKPFHGTYLHNPYKNMNPNNWVRANFHAHTRQFSGITNGRLNTNEMVDSVYSVLGFTNLFTQTLYFSRISLAFFEGQLFKPSLQIPKFTLLLVIALNLTTILS